MRLGAGRSKWKLRAFWPDSGHFGARSPTARSVNPCGTPRRYLDARFGVEPAKFLAIS